jgi:carboxypeptidase family protein
MKRLRLCQYAATAVASVGLVFPTVTRAADAAPATAQATAAEAPTIADVSLGEGGTLSGQVLDAEGNPVADTGVTVSSAGRNVATATTDAEGHFAIGGLSGGVYEVASGENSGLFRLWTAHASPPSANQAILIVTGNPVARGQYPGQPFYGPRYRPVIYRCRPITNGQIVTTLAFAGLVGGIIAVAVNNEKPSGS